jgi:predicted DCC family thiol-disulfide oxidoreductase YuxK
MAEFLNEYVVASSRSWLRQPHETRGFIHFFALVMTGLMCVILASIVYSAGAWAVQGPRATPRIQAATPSNNEARSDVIFRSDTRPVILFDGVCNLCNNAVNIALDWDPDARFRFAALQSDVGKALLVRSGRQPDNISSIVLVENDKSYLKSDAVLRIATGLSNPLLFLVSLPGTVAFGGVAAA